MAPLNKQNLSSSFSHVDILLLVRQKQQDKLYKLRFEARVVPKSNKGLQNSKFSLKLQEILNGNRLMRIDLIEGKHMASLGEDEKLGYKFPFMQLASDKFQTSDVAISPLQRIISVQVIENYPEKNKKTKEVETKKRVWSECIVRLMDLVEYGQTGQELMY
jgi:hypothetical protein